MSESVVSLETLAQSVDDLRDLFRRRLIDDREKRQTIDLLHRRVEELERTRAAETLRPLVHRVALIIDRIQSADATGADLLASVADELHDLLLSLGVSTIDATGDFDPRRHEVAGVDGGDGPRLAITRLLRGGYEKDGVVLRAAVVTVRRTPAHATDQDAAPATVSW